MSFNSDQIIFENGPPPKPKLLLLLTFVSFLSLIPQVRYIVMRMLKHCESCDYIPGFRCLYGNIYAKNVYFGDTFCLDYAPIRIGEGTRFSLGNILITSTHDHVKWSRVVARPITIGKNVWVTTRCTILSGVTIGDNSIIGAGSIVTKDIPSNVFAAGNPCRVIRQLRS
jgi:maltose O-acetyltransferase